MASRRISSDDVNVIFDCMRENRLPPETLQFIIVPTGPDGMKLSPPPYEYHDGLYVLLEPENVGKKNANRNVPSNLASFLMQEFPAANCPWSLSGPQFPNSNGLQQRYCYPRGDKAYASQKGGSLWTICNSSGMEDFTYRLLHVYFSGKRANSSMTASSKRGKGGIVKHRDTLGKLVKKAVEAKDAMFASPTSNSVSSSGVSSNFSCDSSLRTEPSRESPPANVAPPVNMEAMSNERVGEKSAAAHQVTPLGQTVLETTRQSAVESYNSNVPAPGVRENGPQQAHTHYQYSTNYGPPSCPNLPRLHLSWSPLYPARLPPPQQPTNWTVESESMILPDCKNPRKSQSRSSPPATKQESSSRTVTPQTTTAQENAAEVVMLEFEAFWTDPLSMGQTLGVSDDNDIGTKEERLKAFAAKLEVIHISILEKIMEAHEAERASLLNILADWAEEIAQGSREITDNEVVRKVKEENQEE